ncbi:MAG: ABC transporter permease [Clostridia bacterium]|nr:ABC transporter permease [Clostridia bacterium]
MKKKQAFANGLISPMVIWSVAFVGVALLYIIGLSFMTSDGAMSTTGEWTLKNYENIFRPAYLRILLKSLSLAVQTTVICLLIGYPFGYFMARTSPKWRGILLLLIIVPFWTNALIRIYGWKILLGGNGPINEFLKAVGLIQKPLKLLYTPGAILLGMVYALIPFMILPAYTGVEKMDWTVVEAGRDLGASPLKAFVTLTIPLTLPSIMAGCVLVFIPSVGLFFLSDILGGSKEVLVGNLINDAMKKNRDLPFAAALSVVLLAVTAGIISLYQRLGGKKGGLTLF